MADDQKGTSDETPSLMQQFIAQLRGVTEGLEGLTGLGGSLPSVLALPSLPGLPTWPAPGALSAAQLTSIAASIAAQRRSIEALKTQLTAFDEQLAVVEQILEPLAEWSQGWADLEDQLFHLRRGSKTDEPAEGS